MTIVDLPLGMRLKAASGWNQTEADWQRYLDLQPDGCFVAELDSKSVGTLTTAIFGSVAWIAMVLVDDNYRRRGVGSALMGHALEHLGCRGVSTVRLDATPLGQPLYEKLGFTAEYALHRFAGALPPRRPVADVVSLAPAHWDDVLRIDQEATRTDRRRLLARWASEFPDNMRVFPGAHGIEGYCSARPGALAFQVGPCIGDGAAGRRLLEDACHRISGRPICIDIPDANRSAVSWAEEVGLTRQRRLLRMCRGPKLPERVAALWASSGPEMG